MSMDRFEFDRALDFDKIRRPETDRLDPGLADKKTFENDPYLASGHKDDRPIRSLNEQYGQKIRHPYLGESTEPIIDLNDDFGTRYSKDLHPAQISGVDYDELMRLLRPGIIPPRYTVVELEEGAEVDEEMATVASDILDRMSDRSIGGSINTLYYGPATSKYIGRLKPSTPVTFVPTRKLGLMGESMDITTPRATAGADTQSLIYETRNHDPGTLHGPGIADSIRSAIDYLRSRPAGPSQ